MCIRDSQHELHEFLTGRARQWASRASWTKLVHTINFESGPLDEAFRCLDWVLPSEATWLLARAAKFPDDHNLVKGISKLKGLGVSNVVWSKVLVGDTMHIVDTMTISTRKFVEAFFSINPERGEEVSRSALQRLSNVEAWDLGIEAIIWHVRAEIWSDDFKLTIEDVMDLVSYAPPAR